MKSEISIANTDVAMASTCSGSEGTAHSVAVSADDLVDRATKGEFYAMAEYMINEHEDRLAILSKYCVNTNLKSAGAPSRKVTHTAVSNGVVHSARPF